MDKQLLSELLQDLTAYFSTREDVDAAAVFGSVARGTDSAESDVDIMVVADTSELRINAELASIGRKFGRRINAGVWSSAELAWLIIDGSAVIHSILGGEIIPIKGVLPTLAS